MEVMEPETGEDTELHSPGQLSRAPNTHPVLTLLCKKKKLVIMVCIITAIVALAIILPNQGWSISDTQSKNTTVRLPLNVKPLYYKLDIIPFPDPNKNFTIEGKVKVDLICLVDSNSITLHLKRIDVNETSVSVDSKSDSKSIVILEHSYDSAQDFYTVTLGESMRVGLVYSLYIEYTGILADDLVGFYRSSYVDKTTNETRWLGITQFSPTDARRAFPCFDEPTMKAEFEISLGRRNDMSTLSNMNLIKSESMSGKFDWKWEWDHYAKTPLMSTYLVGFAVSDFIPKQSNSSLSKTKFQLWSRKDAISQTEYAGLVGPRILTYFESYFGIDFPLPKLDMIAVPDHRFSAMENWGLITYRELAVLFDPMSSSDTDKRRIADVIAHELAHQWFGNLVTPSWWSELWLKEGFASYVEYIGTNHVEPSWKVLDLFVVNELQKVFRVDALNSSHEISIPVDDPNQINQIFDDISYNKGCSIIRMMDHFLTHRTFKLGITNYLNTWKYNNTQQDDLWKSLTEQAWEDRTLDRSLTVAEIMDTWTLQKGYPVIHIDRNYENKDVTFKQTKFNLMGKEYESYKWWVPISLAYPSNNSDFVDTNPRFWISKNATTSTQTALNDIDSEDWLITNVQQTGYYRVNYDMKNWQNILLQLQSNHSAIHIINRAQIMDDSLYLSRASLLPYAFTFNLTKYLKNETEYMPWYSFLENLKFLSDMLRGTPAMPLLQAYIKGVVRNEYDRLGFIEWDLDSFQERAQRGQIIKWACQAGIEDCIAQSTHLFRQWMGNPNPATENPIPLNLRGNIYCVAIKNGGDEEWNFAWQRYLDANVASEKDRILKALTCSSNADTLRKYQQLAITQGSGVRKQDSRTVLEYIGYNAIGNSIVFKFLQEEWSQIQKYFGSGLSIDRIINNGIAKKLSSDSDLTALEKFKSDHEGDFGFGERAVLQAIEIVKTNIYWMNTNFKAVADWLEQNANTF